MANECTVLLSLWVFALCVCVFVVIWNALSWRLLTTSIAFQFYLLSHNLAKKWLISNEAKFALLPVCDGPSLMVESILLFSNVKCLIGQRYGLSNEWNRNLEDFWRFLKKCWSNEVHIFAWFISCIFRKRLNYEYIARYGFHMKINK